MSKAKSTDDIRKHASSALRKLDALLSEMVESEDPMLADKLSYWLDDYVRLINYEKTFSKKNHQCFKRGDIIKVNLGFRIGHELGGLHYAVVINKHDSSKNPNLTIIPLSSVKPNRPTRKGSVYLGRSLYELLKSKLKAVKNRDEAITREINERLVPLEEKMNDDTIIEEFEKENQSEIKYLLSKTEQMKKLCILTSKIEKEISGMKDGSIAVIGQVLTISKMRIYNPKNDNDVLSGLRLPPKSLDKINDALKESIIF